MPILTFAQPAPPALPGPAPEEELVFDLRRTSTSGADDLILPLYDAYAVQIGAQGLDDVALALATTTPAGWDGDQINDLTASANEIFLPMLASSGSLEGLRALKATLRQFTNPRKGPVRLRVTRPNGGYREITGLRTGLVPGPLDDDSWGVVWQRLGLVLHCSDPFWTEPEHPWHVSWTVRSDTGSPLPILPVAPDASQALGDTNTVTVPGDVETFPVWQLTGPFTAVTVRDEARDLQWTLTATVAPGDTWVVDCRKGRQGVFDPAGVRSRGALSADAFLWGVLPGVSQVTTTVVGASVGASVVGDAPTRWESY